MTRVVCQRLFAVLALTYALAACDAVDSLQDGLKHAQAASTELEKSVGLKSFVGFNWTNGILNSVTVTFQGVPTDRPVSEIAELASAAVLKEFKQRPRQIVIGFAITP
jgi:hypothetical protein